MSTSPPPSPVASVVVPAYNEAETLPRLLRALDARRKAGDLEIVIVPNGCSDDTAAVAREAGYEVVELAEGSKVAALNAGDATVTAFPRFYIDADVVIDGDALVHLAGHLGDEILAAAPTRRFASETSSWLVRSYLRIWDQLPSVSQSLAGRGCYGVSRAGRSRWDTFPDLIADDAFVNAQFDAHERTNPDDVVSVVDAPTTVRGLIERKRRGHRGNRQLENTGAEVTSSTAWLGVVRANPRLVLDVPGYVGVTLITRLLAVGDERRGSTTWTTAR